MHSQPDSLLARLCGLELASVVFVRDYVQLDFDGPRLTCWVWPKIGSGETVLHIGDTGYRDSLCAFIDQTVVSTEDAAGDGLVLRFEKGTLSLDATADKLEGPEIAMLSGFADESWDVWRPGDGNSVSEGSDRFQP
ncbi:hypothetical protein ACQP06_11975 [Nocardia sp. CA-136227]|uniref:hypothetical protein n=1 Tax=Nocardia sp. CA-136227 TaxID=3239979 RepID=UPI003D98F48A